MTNKKAFLLLLVGFSMFISAYSQTATDSTKQVTNTATKIIELSNTVIELANAYSKEYDYFDAAAGKMQAEIRKLVNNPNHIIPDSLHIKDAIAIDSALFCDYKTQLLQAPEYFDGKEAILTAVKKANESINNLTESAKILNLYFESKGYEKDSKTMKIFQSLINNMINSIDQAESAWRNAAREAKRAGNNAENTTIKDSQVSNLIISAKYDVMALRVLTEDIFNEDNHIKDFENLKRQCDYLKGVFETRLANKDQTIKKLKKSKRKYYVSFYSSGFQLLNEMDSLLQLINDKTLKKAELETQKDHIFDSMAKTYREAINSYNDYTTM
jgi:hypothetical protein